MPPHLSGRDKQSDLKRYFYKVNWYNSSPAQTIFTVTVLPCFSLIIWSYSFVMTSLPITIQAFSASFCIWGSVCLENLMTWKPSDSCLYRIIGSCGSFRYVFLNFSMQWSHQWSAIMISDAKKASNSESNSRISLLQYEVIQRLSWSTLFYEIQVDNTTYRW